MTWKSAPTAASIAGPKRHRDRRGQQN
jgi:hypothetical protein